MIAERLIFGTLLIATLGACAPNQEDLRSWMTEERRKTTAKVAPIEEPKRYVPLAYSGAAQSDAFSSERLSQLLGAEPGTKEGNSNLVAPELERRKEPLESFPLDAVTMVGSLNKNSQQIALVRVDNLVHQVRLGNYLGQNYGKITKISDNEVVLREIVQDAAGEWIERNTTLQLQESSK